MTTKTKNSNFVLALATLGACLGLVLAGAAPKVAAQDAARHAGAKGEIEQKRHFDKRPDGEKALEQFAAAFEEFYRVAHELTSGDPFRDPETPFSLNYYVTVKPNGAARLYSHPHFSEDAAPWSTRFREPLMNLYDAFLPRSDDWNENFLVQFSIGPSGVSLKTTILADSPSQISAPSVYENALLDQRSTQTDLVRSQIYQASRVSVEKNKIIVVANLPRAGLDSLLTKEGR